ncbi:MAG: hypothetical protein F2893_04830 [Actinobacteria bacterium]|uniref:Unannotated protein n=1 Tax=freshwater metagenome TaxID=449393 RepID=A0A6J7U054_9ZZZZ|nr:hypothetical protein [Actinomycetota bacterium]MSY49465.1 hypothetical protein [Actinomycetota bacterium]MTH92233.1 hypothetical protein [Actinomycetota bacterium]
MKQLRRVLTLFISLCALLLVLPDAHAHVSVISTSPQYQSTIAKLPVEIVIEFNSPLLTLGTKNPKTIELINPSGLSITVGQARVEGSRVSMAIDQDQPVAGDYTVRYRVISTDGHAVSGSYHFQLSTGQAAVPLPSPQVISDHSFWHIHRTHVIEGLLAALLILGWALYRARFAPGK